MMNRFFKGSRTKHSDAVLPSIATPLYVYPSPEAWKPIFDFLEKNPTVHLHLVINPASGPGGPVPDENYIANVARLNTYRNAELYGYVHVSWANRPIEDVCADITTWSKWSEYSKADIHVEGIFVDEAPSKPDKLLYMRDVWSHARTAFDGKVAVWTNPGVVIDASFYDYADLVNAFENTADCWFGQKSEEGIPLPLRPKSSVMLHSFPGSGGDLQKALSKLAKAEYHTALLTESSSYTELPGLLRH